MINQKQFMLFGMGNKRRKLIYVEGGKLLDAFTLEPICEFKIEKERFEPSEYRVVLFTKKDKEITIFENEIGVFIKENEKIEPLTIGEFVELPSFETHSYSKYLKILHSEILINITSFGPVPNLWAYPKPWYRDAAMALMCLNITGNLHLVEPWVMGLRYVFDLNNRIEEPDNIGQVLYMVSLFEEKKHPIIEKAIKSVKNFVKNSYISGITDGIEHPVYQTKWVKFGFKSLGLEDPFKIPPIPDKYSSIFWMDFCDQHIETEKFSEFSKMYYPYLAWAEAHFYRNSPPPFPPLENLFCPLTWEAKAGQAEYWKLKELLDSNIITENDFIEKIFRPHIWHASEMFLYLYFIKGGQ